MNCKKGDLALVIRGEHSGALVECLEFVGHYETSNGYAADDCWELRSLSDSLRFFFDDGTKREIGYGQDSSLRPVGNVEFLPIREAETA